MDDKVMKIKMISTYFPEQVLTTEMLSKEFPELSSKRIINKIGIRKRYISHKAEYASDMAVAASEKLLSSGIDRNSIDYIILCTQSPDYLLPTTACLVQSRLKLRMEIGAIDVNLGCSGYVYALSLAYGLIKTKQVNTVLIITSDTYTKFLDKNDKTVRAIFGDAATATIVTQSKNEEGSAFFSFGTNGDGAKNLILKNSGTKAILNEHSTPRLYMNGPEIMNFVLNIIPYAYNRLINESKVQTDRKLFKKLNYRDQIYYW